MHKQTQNLEIQYKDLKDIKPNKRNARTHAKKQIAQIVGSMKQFGFTNPVLIDENGVLIAGHGRLEAAKELGLEQVPTIIIKGLSEKEKSALMIADNKLAM